MATTALTGSNQLVKTGLGRYSGYTLRETAGAAAVVRVYDNTSAAGTLLDTVSLAPNESHSEEYANPRTAYTGVYVQIVSGAVEGSVRVD